MNRATNTELGVDAEPQLYHLGEDLGETRNVAVDHPVRVQAMAARLRGIQTSGRSRL